MEPVWFSGRTTTRTRMAVLRTRMRTTIPRTRTRTTVLGLQTVMNSAKKIIVGTEWLT